MKRRDFIKNGAMGLASLCAPTILSAKPTLEDNILSEPKITSHTMLMNTVLLLNQLQHHDASYEEMLQYLHQNLNHFPTMETKNQDLFEFYNRQDILDLHPRQLTRAYLFMKTLENPKSQKKIHAHLVDDFLDKKTEFGGRVTANKGAMILEYLRHPLVDEEPSIQEELGKGLIFDNYHYSLPEGALLTPHLAIYHGHAVRDNNAWKGVLSGERGDAGVALKRTEAMGEDHQLMFNLHDFGFEVVYFGGFKKENGIERFHMRLGQYFQ